MKTPKKTATLYDVSATQLDRDINLTQAVKFSNASAVAANKAAQLHALLQLTYGAGEPAFSALADELRGNLMWLASDLALEIRVLCELESNGAAA